MTYCEQKLNTIYQNFIFSSGVYGHSPHLLSLLYKQVLDHLNEQLANLRKGHYPEGELTYYGNFYRRLITQYYNSYQARA